MRSPAMTLNSSSSDLKGFVFDIQGLSVHDGPGCRTLIFLCGCTMNCFWCSNPEGISPKPALMYSVSKCILCGACAGKCEHHAINIEDGKLNISRSFCLSCEQQNCTDECYSGALRFSGYEISLPKLYSIIRRDRQYWGSEGGVTLTGGEPLLQLDFVKSLLQKCHEDYIHTAIETCGNIPWNNFQKVIPYLDWIFFDLKNMDNTLHMNATSAGNMLVLENAKRLSDEFQGRLIFRIPLLPGFNDSEENINSVISFLRDTGRKEINILPLHHLGREKYQLLQKSYTGGSYPVPVKESLETIRKMFNASGVDCYIGSETPF